jgi:HAE1 family hydrophobic/amphiphilic exporter-1
MTPTVFSPIARRTSSITAGVSPSQTALVGRVFREFALTISVAILVSGFVSLTLTPMLCARVLKQPDHSKEPIALLRWSETIFDKCLAGYRSSLDLVLHHRPFMLGTTIVTLFLAVALYIWVPKGFFPVEDTGFISGTVEARTDIGFPAMRQHMRDVVKAIRTDPNVDYVVYTAGATFTSPTSNTGRVFMALKPKNERDDVQTVIGRLRRTALQVPGLQAFFQGIQNLNIGGRISKSQYQYVLQSGDSEALYRLAPQIRDKMAQVPGLLDVTTDLYIKNPQLSVEVDREKAAVFGISVGQIRNELFNAYGTRQVGTIYMPSNDYKSIMEAKPEYRVYPADLSKL